MKLLTTLLFIPVFNFFVSAQTVNIEQLSDCWDIRPQITSEERTKSFVYWLRGKNIKEYDSALLFCNNLGFRLGDLLSRFQFETNQSGWDKLQIEMDLFTSSNYEFKDRFTWYVEDITPFTKNIFETCFKSTNSFSYLMYTGNPFKFIMVKRDVIKGYTEAIIERKDSSAFTIHKQIKTTAIKNPSIYIPAINPLPLPNPQITADSLTIQRGSSVAITCVVRNGLVGELKPIGLWICGNRTFNFRPLDTTRYELIIYGNDNKVFSKTVTVTVAKK